jgi:hypothetical protein
VSLARDLADLFDTERSRIARAFRASVNMSPAEIRAWARDPRSKRYSFEATRRRLPALARLVEKPESEWTKRDVAYAKRVISFNARMEGALRRDGCRQGYAVSLRNWGRAPEGCEVDP